MPLDIEHHLTFEYDAFVRESIMELRVEPRSSQHQTVRSFAIAVGPPSKVFRYVDWNGNLVHHFGIADYHDRIEVVTRSLVDVHPGYPPPDTLTDRLPFAESRGELHDFTVFGGPVRRSPALESVEATLPVAAAAPLGEQLRGIGHFLFEGFTYQKEVTDYQSTTDDVLSHRSGVCQDFAHVMLALLRLRGIPARYVSGYVHIERDGFAQSHAWVEAYSPQRGWVPFDPTHDRVPDECYAVVAVGRHYDDVSPNRGIYRGGAKERLRAEVRTRRVERGDLPGLREEVGQIDLPVFRELPPGGATAARTAQQHPEADPLQQQQQQQQQRA